MHVPNERKMDLGCETKMGRLFSHWYCEEHSLALESVPFLIPPQIFQLAGPNRKYYRLLCYCVLPKERL
jgi:hypothetical protein